MKSHQIEDFFSTWNTHIKHISKNSEETEPVQKCQDHTWWSRKASLQVAFGLTSTVFFHSWMSFGIPRATRCPDGSNIPVYSALGLVWENESIFADLALSLWRWSLHIFYLPADVFEEREVIRGLPGLSNWHPGLLSQARGSPHLPAGKSLSHSWLLWLQWSRHEPPAPGRTWDSGLVSLERSLS